MTAIEPIPYTDAKIRRILSTVRTIAMVGASTNWNRPSYFVMKYLQGKGYRVIPVNPAAAGQELQGEHVYASLRDIPDKIDMVDIFRASDQVPPIVEDAIAIGAKVVWMQLGIRNDEPRRARRSRGHRSHHEPLPEDRIRPPRRRAVVERRQLRHHPQPRAGAADRAPRQAAADADAQHHLRLRNPRDPCRRRARSHHRRAHHADLPDHGLCFRRRRSRRVAVQSAQFRLHLHAADQSHRRGAGGTGRQPGRRPRRGRRRIRPRRAVPGLRHDDGAGRRVRRLAQPVRRIADAVRPVVQEAWLDLPFCRSDRSGEFPPRADAALQGDLRRKPGQSRRRHRRSGGGGEGRARRRHSADRR